MVNRIISIFFLFLFIGIALSVTPINAGERPKIGLVLGGGGARGAAHVGVIRILEENNVPVDYIVGTSMGSIVGGLYAAGYSPDEMDDLFKKIDWVNMFSDRPKENMLTFRNKQDFQKLAALEMGVKDGKIQFPRGMVAGQKLEFMLSKLTIHTINLDNYDKLRIPFRAVATDAETGKAVIFKNGNLAQAIRASMSVPGAFPPVKYEDKLLIDGFLAYNVPVEIVKEMGADIVIAVDVGTDLAKKEELNSFLDLANQMVSILSQQNVNKSLSLLTDKDLLIKPDLGTMSSADFANTPDAVSKGEKTARNMVDKIKKYSVSENEYKIFLANQRQRKSEEFVVDSIHITKAERVNHDTIKGRMQTKPGQNLDISQLEQDLTNIYSMGDFETVNFHIEKIDGKDGLVIEANEKSWGPNYLRLGLNLHNDTAGSSGYSLIADYRMTQLNRLGGEWKSVLEFGENFGAYTEFYQPINTHNYYFLTPYFKARRDFADVYHEKDRIAEYQKDEIGAGLDLGVNLRSYLELSLGIHGSYVTGEPSTGATNLPAFDNIVKSGIRAKIDYDQLDDHKFPTKGEKLFAEFYHSDKSLGSDSTYDKISFFIVKATTFTNKHTLLTALSGGISLHDDLPYYDEFTMGGFLNLSGLGDYQLRGQNKGLGQLIYYYEIANPTGLVDHVYAGGSLELGNVWDDSSEIWNDPIIGGSLFLGVDTKLGPLYLAYAMAEGFDKRIYLYLGKTF